MQTALHEGGHLWSELVKEAFAKPYTPENYWSTAMNELTQNIRMKKAPVAGAIKTIGDLRRNPSAYPMPRWLRRVLDPSGKYDAHAKAAQRPTYEID
jgi:hypothetical protein